MRKVSIALLCLALSIVMNALSSAMERTAKASSASDSGTVYFLRHQALWAYDVGTRRERRITHDRRVNGYCVAPDRGTLMYTDRFLALYRADRDGGNEALIARSRIDLLLFPSLSPGGDRLVFTGRSAAPMERLVHFLSNTYGQYVRHIWLMDLRTNALIDLTPASQYPAQFAVWSPDGSRIAYSVLRDPWWTFYKDAEWEVVVMEMDADRATRTIGPGLRSQWVDDDNLAVLDSGAVKVYNIRSKQVVKEMWINDSCATDFALGRKMDLLVYRTFCGDTRGRAGLVLYDVTSGKKRGFLRDATYPVYVE